MSGNAQLFNNSKASQKWNRGGYSDFSSNSIEMEFFYSKGRKKKSTRVFHPTNHDIIVLGCTEFEI